MDGAGLDCICLAFLIKNGRNTRKVIEIKLGHHCRKLNIINGLTLFLQGFSAASQPAARFYVFFDGAVQYIEVMIKFKLYGQVVFNVLSKQRYLF